MARRLGTTKSRFGRQPGGTATLATLDKLHFTRSSTSHLTAPRTYGQNVLRLFRNGVWAVDSRQGIRFDVLGARPEKQVEVQSVEECLVGIEPFT